MFFTKEDYLKIERWLSSRALKDTDFPIANPIGTTDAIAIIQNNKNKKLLMNDFFYQLATLYKPDEEDITALNLGKEGGIFKFKNKEYDPDIYSGLGRIFVRKTEGGVITQDCFSEANTIYIIQYDHDLNGDSITIPEGCVLWFQGGSFTNGTLILTDTRALGVRYYEEIGDVTIEGTFKLGQIMTFLNDYSSLDGGYFALTSVDNNDGGTRIKYVESDLAYKDTERQELMWWDGTQWLRLLDYTDYTELKTIISAIIDKIDEEIDAIYYHYTSDWVKSIIDEDYIKNIINEDYLKSIINSSYLKSIIDSDYVRSLLDADFIQSFLDSDFIRSFLDEDFIQSFIDADFINSLVDMDAINTLISDAINAIPSYDLPIATTSTLGGVIIGSGISVTSTGTISINDSYIQSLISANTSDYTLPVATSSVLGGVKIGEGIDVTSAGVISVDEDWLESYISGISSGTSSGNYYIHLYSGDGTSYALDIYDGGSTTYSSLLLEEGDGITIGAGSDSSRSLSFSIDTDWLDSYIGGGDSDSFTESNFLEWLTKYLSVTTYTTEGTRIATIALGNVAYALYAPTSSSSDSYWYNSGSNLYAGTSTTPFYAAYATAFYESSDARLKNNIFDIDKSDLEKVDQIQHKTFTVNVDGSEHYGVIAQSVEEAGLERLVSTNEDGYKSVDYTSLLILENESLRKKVASLEERLAAIEAKLG